MLSPPPSYPSPPQLPPQLRPSSLGWHDLGSQRLAQFVTQLTATLPTQAGASGSGPTSPPRVVLSSGGAAGGVISEGQGYGLLLSAAALAALPPSDPSRAAAVDGAFSFFMGWKTMCTRTALRRRRRRSLQSCDCSWVGEHGANCGSGDGSVCWTVCCGDGAADNAAASGAPSNASVPTPAYTSCQNEAHECGRGGDGGGALCLRSWKFDDQVTTEVGTGSAPDGDEDAILGMIVLLVATQHDEPRPAWWRSLAEWAYDSCSAFLQFNTAVHPAGRQATNGQALRIVKLGSCWGGWDCANPSYYAPGHYRAFKHFMLANAHLAPPPPLMQGGGGGGGGGGSGGSGSGSAVYDPAPAASAAAQWDALIEASYKVLFEAQCAETGLVPNWFVPSLGELGEQAAEGAKQQWPQWSPGTASCSGSGTPAAAFGAEASRTVWRVSLDALWHAEPRALAFCQAIVAHAIPKLIAANSTTSGGKRAGGRGDGSSQLETPGACRGRVDSVHADWLKHGFMLGPVAAALMVPLPSSHPQASSQQAALDVASLLLRRLQTREYYPLSWISLSTLTLSGAFPGLGPLLVWPEASGLTEDTSPAAAGADDGSGSARGSGGTSGSDQQSEAADSGASPVLMPVAALSGLMLLLLLLLLCVCARRIIMRQHPAGAMALRQPPKGSCSERQPLSNEMEEEWVMHVESSGRPFWSNGKRSTWSKPSNRTHGASPSHSETSDN